MPRNSSFDGTFKNVCRSKAPIAGSPRTSRSASASRPGARKRCSVGSRYSEEATMSPRRRSAGGSAGVDMSSDPLLDEPILLGGACAGNLQGVAVERELDAPGRLPLEPGTCAVDD